VKLLVVDDDRDLVELLDYALRREGYDVVRAYDGVSLASKCVVEKLHQVAVVIDDQ